MRVEKLISLFSLFFLSISWVTAAELTVVYNNITGDPSFGTAWGLSYLIRDKGKTILFDTGGDPYLLQQNLEQADLRRDKIDIVVISHYHRDHYGGLKALLRPGLKIFLPCSFPPGFINELKARGIKVIEVKGPVKIAEGIWSTGEMGWFIPEQSLILKTPRGLVIVTGCSHAGVENVCRRARDRLKEKIYLVTGGFHLGGASPRKIRQIIEDLKSLGVQKVAPNHCTGSVATRMFKEAWGDDFIHLGVGESFNIRDVEADDHL